MAFNLFNRKNRESQVSKPTDERSDSSAMLSFSCDTSDGDIPDLQGDYAKAVFLWATDKTSPVRNDNEYARYITYECGIRHPRAYHEDLIREGYLEKDSVDNALNYLKATDLKAMAADLGVSGSGKKADIISRIIAVSDMGYICQHCPVTFSLSPKGKRFLDDHVAYVQLHKNRIWDVDWKEYDAVHKPDESFYDTMIGIFKTRASKDTLLFGRQEYYYLHQICLELGNRASALAYLLQVFYIDVSGVCGLDSYQRYKEGIFTKQDLKSWFVSNVMLAPGIIQSITKLEDVYSDMIVDKLYSWRLPVQICSKQLFLSMVHTALTGTFDVERATSQLKASYDHYIDRL